MSHIKAGIIYDGLYLTGLAICRPIGGRTGLLRTLIDLGRCYFSEAEAEPEQEYDTEDLDNLVACRHILSLCNRFLGYSEAPRWAL